jgi:hypothetical protein
LNHTKREEREAPDLDLAFALFSFLKSRIMGLQPVA